MSVVAPTFVINWVTLARPIRSRYTQIQHPTERTLQRLYRRYHQCTFLYTHTHPTANVFQIESPNGPRLLVSIFWSTPTKIDCSGNVFATDETTDSFVVTVWQEIWGIPPLTPFTIRAIMSLNVNEERPYQRLPAPGTLIHFGGNLLTIQNGIAFVAVHYHSYFPTGNDDVLESQFV